MSIKKRTFSSDINTLQKEMHEISTTKGFTPEKTPVLQLLLIASEVAEALENYEIDVSNRAKPIITRFNLAMQDLEFLRKNVKIADNSRLHKQNNLAEEMADIVIRTFVFAESLGIDLQKEIHEKSKMNIERPYKHNKFF